MRGTQFTHPVYASEIPQCHPPTITQKFCTNFKPRVTQFFKNICFIPKSFSNVYNDINNIHFYKTNQNTCKRLLEYNYYIIRNAHLRDEIILSNFQNPEYVKMRKE